MIKRLKITEEKEQANGCGDRIRRIRQEKGYSQNVLAIQLQLVGVNMTQKIISRIETGERVVPDYEIWYLAEALGASVTFLLGLEEDNVK